MPGRYTSWSKYPKKYNLLLLVLIACSANKFTVWQSTDRFHPGTTTYNTDWIQIKGTGFFSHSSLKFRPQYITSDNGHPSYSLQFIFIGDDWAFLDNIIFLIDGQTYTFYSNGNPQHQIWDNIVVEIVNIGVDESLFKIISDAGAVAIRARGTQNYFEKDFDQSTIGKLKFFYSTISKK